MGEFIGSRISLVSKRDIRYVGTLHEINSENSTVALEQVVSFGTEGRRPGEEVPASDNVYEYIVFRGSDVKDLRIEEPAPPKENKPPPVLDDPAILGSARRPDSSSAPQGAGPPATQTQTPPIQAQQNALHQGPNQQQQQRQQPPPHYPNQPPFGYPYGPPPNQRFGPYGVPPGPGFQGMPYGAPPPWGYPPPGQGFSQGPPRPFYNQQMPIGPGGHSQPQGPPPQQTPPVGTPVNQQIPTSPPQHSPDKAPATVKLPSTTTTPAPTLTPSNGPPPPTESKPNVAAALAPPAPAIAQQAPLQIPQVAQATKSGRIIPAVPRVSPAVKPAQPVNGTTRQQVNGAPPAQSMTHSTASRPQPAAINSIEAATLAAAAAVQTAMAKLPPQGAKKESDAAMENLTNKVNEMRTNDHTRSIRQPGTNGHRGGRGGRGGRNQSEQQNSKPELPKTDYDFATANAKFNKQDLVKEAIATGSSLEEGQIAENDMNVGSGIDVSTHHNSEPVIIPPGPGYNKKSSFFDNISSEAKERADDGGKRLGGREFRSEEQKKNLETFGQGSVDGSYRGGYRGRGRGRAYGGRGRGYSGTRSRGRGGRAGIVSTET